MSAKLPLPLKLPPEIWRWIRQEAARRRMPFGNFTLELIRRGILDENLEQKIARVSLGTPSPALTREMFRQLILIRHLLERHQGLPQQPQIGRAIELAVDEELAQRWPEEES